MSFLKDILGGLIKPITDVVGKAVVDKDKVREIELELEKLVDQADQRYHEQLMGQIEVNKQEAQHSSIFVAGWRPFIGWTSGVGVAYSFILSPFIETFSRILGYTGELPHLDTSELMVLITGMLGLSGMRTYEHFKGVSRNSIK